MNLNRRQEEERAICAHDRPSRDERPPGTRWYVDRVPLPGPESGAERLERCRFEMQTDSCGVPPRGRRQLRVAVYPVLHSRQHLDRAERRRPEQGGDNRC